MYDICDLGGAGRIAAVVTTHNRLGALQANLARMLAEPAFRLAHVIVVDTASSDGTAAWLATQDDPRLFVHRTKSNIGGAGGFAEGIRLAMYRYDPDWVLVMDDDARPTDTTFAKFHKHPRDHRDAWAAAVFYPSGELCEMNRPTRNPFWHGASFLKALLQGRKGFHLSDAEFHGTATLPVDVASFVGLFLSRDVIEHTGYPDRSIFIYGDDVLYSLAIRKAGGQIEFDPNLHFEHECSAYAFNTKTFEPVWRAYYHHRNLLLVYRAAAGRWFWPAILLIVPRWLLRARRYGARAPVFRALLRRAIRDGLRQDTSATHPEVLAFTRQNART